MKRNIEQQPDQTTQEKHIIIGTAGHIDHGKTALIKALTGIDTDRLPEEKQRGLTIDLGFAYMDLDAGKRISIVDVPGHERFVKNMLAGAASINFVLFVIAADDGVMPQTVEHLEIINLLEIKHGLVVLTKKDLVTEDWLKLVEEDVKNLLRGTSLERVPIISVSSVTGEGIDACKALLKNLLSKLHLPVTTRIFRMPIDRSFTLPGHGCIITGPIIGGQISVEDEVEVLPVKRVVRTRGIQVTGIIVPVACEGQRAAINLSGIKSSEIKRGYELSVPGYLQPANIIDTSVRLIKGMKRPLKNRTRIRFHVNTTEVMGRVILLNKDQLNPGEHAFVQFLLESPITVERGDRFIIRSYSPVHTIGGGKVLRYNTKRLKRFSEDAIRTLTILASDNLSDIVEEMYLQHKDATVDSISIQVNIHPRIVENTVMELLEKGILLKLYADSKGIVVHRNCVNSLKDRLLNIIKGFHEKNPLKAGIEEAQLRTSLGKDVNPALISALLAVLREEKSVKIIDNKISSFNFNVTIPCRSKDMADKIEELFLKADCTPPAIEEVFTKFGSASKDIIQILTEKKILIEVDKGMFFHTRTINNLMEVIREFVNKHGPITVAQFRDITNTSRKFAVPLLEYFDRIQFTRRRGDVRVLLR